MWHIILHVPLSRYFEQMFPDLQARYSYPHTSCTPTMRHVSHAAMLSNRLTINYLLFVGLTLMLSYKHRVEQTLILVLFRQWHKQNSRFFYCELLRVRL